MGDVIDFAVAKLRLQPPPTIDRHWRNCISLADILIAAWPAHVPTDTPISEVFSDEQLIELGVLVAR